MKKPRPKFNANLVLQQILRNQLAIMHVIWYKTTLIAQQSDLSEAMKASKVLLERSLPPKRKS